MSGFFNSKILPIDRGGYRDSPGRKVKNEKSPKTGVYLFSNYFVPCH